MAFHFAYSKQNLVLKSTLFDGQPLNHGFGTRVQAGPAGPVNPDRLYGLPGAVAVPGPFPDLPRGGMVSLQQIHSARLWQVETGPAGVVLRDAGNGLPARSYPAEGDGLLTRAPEVLLQVRSADCFPVLLYDPDYHAGAAVHSGWRGTLAGIAGEAVRAMAGHYGSRPETIRAAVGPGIQGCCFEVGKDVAETFAAVFPEWCRADGGGKVRVDLRGCIRHSLLDAGLRPDRIDLASWCTVCRGELFYSYRREKAATGRMFNWICLSDPGQGFLRL